MVQIKKIILLEKKREWGVFVEGRSTGGVNIVDSYSGQQLFVLQRGQGLSIGTWLVSTHLQPWSPTAHQCAEDTGGFQYRFRQCSQGGCKF